MKIEFERNQLYLEVWNQPLTQLAKRYQMSDNGLRKVCKALNIPLPIAGHWAKVAVGKAVTVPPLPPSERTTFTSHPPGETQFFAQPEDAQWKAERVVFENQPENRCNVDLKPHVWHVAVAPLRKQLLEAVCSAEKLRRESERKQNNRRVHHQPDLDGWRWRSFVDAGQILNHTHKKTAMRVSPSTYERALAAP